MNFISKIKQGIRNRIALASLNNTNTSTSNIGKHNNHYEFTEEDHKKSAEARRLKAEIRRQKEIRQAYLEKLQDDLVMKDLQSQMNELDDDKENMEDFLMKQALTKILGGQGLGTTAAPQENSFNSFEQQVMSNAEVETPQEEEPVEPSRFTNEQLKENIPKLLNAEQIKLLKGLNEEEVFQMYDIIKKDL